jgi:hypothetical protein
MRSRHKEFVRATSRALPKRWTYAVPQAEIGCNFGESYFKFPFIWLSSRRLV